MAPRNRQRNKKISKPKKTFNPTRKGKRILQYTEDQMAKAILDVNSGVSIKRAAINNNVPRITLLGKIKKKSPPNTRMGPATILSQSEEKMIVDWLLFCKKMNFPVPPTLLLDSVQSYLLKKRVNTTFKDSRPGRTWIERFQRRHPYISLRTPQNLTKSRSEVTESDIEAWANRVYAYFQEEGYDSILEHPQRVFNTDETAVFLNPKEHRVFAGKGDKTVYQQVNSDEKECLTVLVTANAAGILAPPLVVLKYERIPEAIAASTPREWGLGKSPESGWMTASLFYEYIVNVFDPWLSRNQVNRPVILFMDGHSSHVALHTSLFCRDNGIILATLYPNSTHLTQPMDVSVFKSLKNSWKSAVQLWRIKHIEDPVLRKKDFCPLLKTVLDEIPSSAIVKGFRACGLVPWNPSVVVDRMRKQKSRPDKADDNDQRVKFNIQAHWTALKVLEGTIGKEKVGQFYETDEAKVKAEDKALYTAWKKIKDTVFPRELYSISVTVASPSGGIVVDESSELPPGDIVLDESSELPPGDIDQDESSELPPGDIVLDESSELPPGDIVQDESSKANNVQQRELQPLLLDAEPAVVKVHSQEGTATDPCMSYQNPGPSTSSSMANDSVVGVPFEIPSPFKTARFFPDRIGLAKKENARKRKKTLFPDVVTSESWQEFYRKKALKKQEEADAKKKREEERLKKELERELLQQEKKEKNGQKIQMPKTKASNQRKPATRKISKPRNAKKPLAISSSEEEKKRAEEQLKKKLERELLQQGKKEKNGQKIQMPKTKASNQRKPAIRKISKPRNAKKPLAISSSEEEDDWSASESSETQANSDSNDEDGSARRALLLKGIEGRSTDSTNLKILSNANGICRLDILMDSPHEIPLNAEDEDVNDEALDQACISLLDTVQSFQNQDKNDTDNPLGIENEDIVSVGGENASNQKFKVTTLLADSFIGIPLLPVHKTSNIYRAEMEESRLIFTKDVIAKLNPLLLGENTNVERRYLFQSSN